ncbi:hypothetical protein E2C01_004290 [Portunus trituberculatus]|uniref:Uncharacterized protein n=1 Tax=Portunus trituberculatus TaxID=210409 RepID=A0A5B7CQB7_PORTR|nr:hypothetical protein [Portunus trituberculatus]
MTASMRRYKHLRIPSIWVSELLYSWLGDSACSGASLPGNNNSSYPSPLTSAHSVSRMASSPSQG